MNLETAKTITQQWYPKSSEPLLTYLLDKFAVSDSGGQKFYRAFIVSAIFIKNEYKRLVKADVATFEFQDNAWKNLLELQAMEDAALIKNGLVIPPEISIDFFDTTKSTISVMVV